MHIAHICTNLTWRGGEQQVAYLLEELAAKGVTQSVICLPGSVMEEHCQQKGYNYYSIKKNSSVSLRFALKLRKFCLKQGVTITHAHDSHAHTFMVLADALFGGMPAMVVSRRVDFPVSKSIFSRFKYNYLKIKKIICVSHAIQAITAPAIRDKSVLVTVHSGNDMSRFSNFTKNGKLHKELGINEDIKLVGNVAALAPHKDYFTFIDTVELLVKKELNAKYLIIGSGPLEKEIKAYVAAKKLEGHILFLGFRKDIPDVLPELDVFLITSETEGLGTSVLDAMACKVPVVATNAGGIPEMVKHLETGWLGEVKTPESLAEGVEKILTDKQLSVRLTDAAAQMLQSFTKQAMAAGILAEYKQL